VGRPTALARLRQVVNGTCHPVRLPTATTAVQPRQGPGMVALGRQMTVSVRTVVDGFTGSKLQRFATAGAEYRTLHIVCFDIITM